MGKIILVAWLIMMALPALGWTATGDPILEDGNATVANLSASGSFSLTGTVSTAVDYSPTTADVIIAVDTAAARHIGITDTLNTDGRYLVIKDATGNAGVANITIESTVNIDGATTATISTAYGCKKLIYSAQAGKWLIISEF